MSMADRLNELRHGLHRTFWIANTLELFERFAFYGSKAVLVVYLAEKVGLGPQAAGSLVGAFSGVLYFLPVLAGTLVDRYGFRRTLAACFGIFTVGYFPDEHSAATMERWNDHVHVANCAEMITGS